ncbi:transcriptional regulator [Streptomyces sp. NPDC002514]|uniref:transcriptional regulator n=1 Tax=unclassified Streptomyces TaxID=2593676 RepID=UPI0036C65D7F
MRTLLALAARTTAVPGTRAPGPVHRVRTLLLHPARGTLTVDEHVRVRLPAGHRWPQLGDVLLAHGTGARTAAETAATHPGALVVAVHHGPRCWLRLGRDGTVLELEAAGPTGRDEAWGTLASLAHTWLVAGLPAAEFAAAPVRLLGAQVTVPSPASRPSRSRADSASADRERPTEA